MAIIFYPAISGVAQSYNYYPISYMKPEDGLAHVALGLGKIVVEGGAALSFSPKYPQFLPPVFNDRRYTGKLTALLLCAQHGRVSR